MDERIFQFKAGRPIPEWDLKHRLSINNPVGPECKDTSTIFRINSTFMDVTDQPFRERQWLAGGVLVSCLGVVGGMWSYYLTRVLYPDAGGILGDLYCLVITFLFGYFAFRHGRDEFFSLKRRPIRFNRKEKKIYAIRRRRFFAKPGQGDITWEVPWDENAIFCIHRGYSNHRNTYHIRHYEVDEEGNVVRAFAIGREWEQKENLQGLLSQWNYWCWYMNRGPEDLPKPPLFFCERESAMESFLFCLYDFGASASAAYRIAMMPFILLLTSHRLMALWTCRDPIWPAAVEKVSVVRPGDPYDEPSRSTPVGWGDTLLAIERNEYPYDPQKEVNEWLGEKDPAVNALLWSEDAPPNWRMKHG
ncbi:DUF6708 domain-containing protein [Herbaspirillum sp. C9C3]|uniref:DUF6708 domain-containing protein n=1 Tax=Herbaspirillum sp. C9C3 TaxID=2735271 RepID=UPI001584BA42|nr:DUF6708 domain-containing protein [Herbaspirillum sp. C9C3]NUT63800.1 hypothetical protein [Herbaspirillum sp. C9C3]